MVLVQTNRGGLNHTSACKDEEARKQTPDSMMPKLRHSGNITALTHLHARPE